MCLQTINLNKGTQNGNEFTFGPNKDFREYKNKLNKEQFSNKYTTLASSDYTTKNIMYNILDLFAKNFFGVYLGFVLLYSM
jgi:hypothetical protein